MILTYPHICILVLAFIWSGFVRGGLGFGGVALMLPIALLAVASPLDIIPIIAIQLFVFSLLTTIRHFYRVNWRFVCNLSLILIIPVSAGLFGLITFPSVWLMSIVYIIIAVYAVYYIFPFQINIRNSWVDSIVLIFGGYMLGVSLSGGPPIVAVAMKRLPKEQVRDTLFALWTILSAAKIISLYLIGVSLHMTMQLWLLPAAAMGHIIGTRFHQKLLNCRSQTFYRILGGMLLCITIIGLLRVWLDNFNSM